MRYPAFVVAAAFVAAPVAYAQPTSSKTGFPIGEKSRIHTRLSAGISFDSNPERVESDVTKSDWRFIARPGVSIDVPGQSVQFRAEANATLSTFFEVNGQAADRSQLQVGTDVGMALRLGSRRSKVAFALDNTLVRTPTYRDTAAGFVERPIGDAGAVGPVASITSDEVRFKEWRNRGKARITFRPGGGALSFDVGYTNDMSFFDNAALPDSHRHGALLEARLKFLPKTAAVFHADFSFYQLFDNSAINATNRSTPFNVELGLVGQITRSFSAEVYAGYADSLTWNGGFFSDFADTNQRTPTGRVTLGYQFNENSRISASYMRHLAPIILLDNYIGDAIRLKFDMSVISRLVFGLSATYEFRGYGLENRDAQVLVGGAQVTYWFFDFLNASVNYRILRQDADDGEEASALILGDYTRHQVFLNVGLQY